MGETTFESSGGEEQKRHVENRGEMRTLDFRVFWPSPPMHCSWVFAVRIKMLCWPLFLSLTTKVQVESYPCGGPNRFLGALGRKT
ncbi:hypothetical protein V6N11_040407 [Hibiscus sabdariffa]|uniref:Uncharacterized protein n=1 Tax=Hibiscus sabdariffa TaxID=183260 RepID=A0ABR2RHM0_9ROSI